MRQRILAMALLCVSAVTWAAAPPAPWTEAQKAKLDERERLLKSLPKLLKEKQYDKAIEARERIVALTAEVYGTGDQQTIFSMRHLAALFESLGRFADAIKTRAEIHRRFAERFDAKHWLVIDARRELANAERLGKLTAEQREKFLQANALNQQVERQLGQGKAKETLALAVKVRGLREEVLGKKHPDYAQSLNNLAALYKGMGENAKALPLYKETLAINEEVLGKKHPHYAASLNNLAALYQSMGEAKEAVESSALALRALEGHLDDSFDHLGERQRNHALHGVLRNLGLLLSLQEQAEIPPTQRYAPVLAWKGRVASRGELDRVAATDQASAKVADQLRQTRARLAWLALLTRHVSKSGKRESRIGDNNGDEVVLPPNTMPLVASRSFPVNQRSVALR